MTRIILALATATALLSTQAQAFITPDFTPNLSFPTPSPQPDVSTKGCNTSTQCK